MSYSNTPFGSSASLKDDQQSCSPASISSPQTWTKFSKGVQIKRFFDFSSKFAKRRKIGIDNTSESKKSKPKSFHLFQKQKLVFLNKNKENGTSIQDLDTNNIKRKENVENATNLGLTTTSIISDEIELPNFIKVNGLSNSSVSKDTSIPNGHQEENSFSHNSIQSPSVNTKNKKQKYKLSRRNSSEQFVHLGLLAPAFILHPSIHHNHVLTKKLSDKFGHDLHLKLAAAHINDAINGHGKFGEARAIFKPPYIQKCFKIISSFWWIIFLYLTIIVHSAMIFFEQPTTPVSVGQKWLSGQVHVAIPCIDAFCLVVYFVDIVLHSLFFTWRNIWRSKEAVWLRVEIAFTCLFTIDFAIFLAEIITRTRLICPFRCFRAYMLLCKSKNVAHIFNVLLSIISKLGKVLFIIAIFLVTFASIGLHLFMQDYHGLITNCSTIQETKNCTNIYEGAFDNVANAALHMFVLMSTENYPEFIIPAFIQSWANIFYFGIFLYVGVFFLTAILLAIIVESYWDYSKRHVKHERRQQREELAIAWNLMDPLGNGQISVNDKSLLTLFQTLKPENSDEENLELINYISLCGDGVIDSYDWTTRLVDALSFEFEEEPSESPLQQLDVCSNRFCSAFQKMCRHIMHANAVSVAILVLILIHSVMFCLMWTGIPDAVQLGIQSARTGIVGLFFIEVILRIIADGKELFNVFDILDMMMVLCAVAGDIAWYIIWFDSREPVYLGACVVVSGLAVLIRAVFNSKHARNAVRILRNICPVMFDLILLVTTIIFSFAVLGFELFQDKTLNQTIQRGYEGSYVEYGCNVGFDTFACSLLIVFQIVTTNDWQEIMLGAMLDAGSSLYALYFVACYLIVDMIVMNLFVAISIEAYKKLAVDNSTLPNKSSDVNQNNPELSGSRQKINQSFATSARTTLGEIFATSRKSKAKASVNSSTLTGYASSPYAVRRGTLGSLGLHTPTPSPRLGDRKASPKPAFQTRVTRIEDEKVALEEESSPSSGELKQRSVERRQKELRERQRRKRASRKTKTDESDEPQSGTKLQINDVVNLKKMVRVIKSFHARNLNEMDVKEGDLVSITGDQRDNMFLGPKGWFPAANVTEKVDPAKPVQASSSGTFLTPYSSTSSAREKPRVQFDISSLEPKPHRISQTRMVKKTDGADWRRDIHGDMTVMNKDEMKDLSRLIRGGLERRHTSRLRNTPSQFSLGFREEIREDEEEESSVPRLMVSEVVEPIVEETDNTEANNDTNTLTLPVPQPRAPHMTKKKSKPSGDGQMPEWMQKFVSERQINLDQDVKFEESSHSNPSSGDERNIEMAKVTVHERKRKRIPSPKRT